jgi:hypothetical protein
MSAACCLQYSECGCAAGSVLPVDLPSGSEDAVQAALTAAMGMTVSCHAGELLYGKKIYICACCHLIAASCCASIIMHGGCTIVCTWNLVCS